MINKHNSSQTYADLSELLEPEQFITRLANRTKYTKITFRSCSAINNTHAKQLKLSEKGIKILKFLENTGRAILNNLPDIATNPHFSQTLKALDKADKILRDTDKELDELEKAITTCHENITTEDQKVIQRHISELLDHTEELMTLEADVVNTIAHCYKKCFTDIQTNQKTSVALYNNEIIQQTEKKVTRLEEQGKTLFTQYITKKKERQQSIKELVSETAKNQIQPIKTIEYSSSEKGETTSVWGEEF